MAKRELLRKIKKKTTITKIERDIYIISCLLFLTTLILNTITIIYNPYLINGLILEINIFITTLLIYTTIKKQKKIYKLEDKQLELKIECLMNK